VPTFNEYVNAAPSGKVISFPLEFPSFQLDIDKFATEAIRRKADVAVVVTPNNPTSMSIPKNDLIRLAEQLAANDCMLVIDESFLDFAEKPDELTMESEIERFPNTAVIKSMSKAYGICGIRIGYLLTANSEFAESFRRGVHIWNINGVAEEVLRLLPDFRHEFIESCRQVRIDRDRLYQRVRSIEGMRVCKPDANFLFFRLPDHVQSGHEITKRLFIEHNIYIKACVEKHQPESGRYLRIASRTEEDNCKLVEALIDVINSNI
jgi:histidinol-phosphate/aromatic aminotransferase/cobyric acid decarboxylase-like protein